MSLKKELIKLYSTTVFSIFRSCWCFSLIKYVASMLFYHSILHLLQFVLGFLKCFSRKQLVFQPSNSSSALCFPCFCCLMNRYSGLLSQSRVIFLTFNNDKNSLGLLSQKSHYMHRLLPALLKHSVWRFKLHHS
jgi:hypothetical protein